MIQKYNSQMDIFTAHFSGKFLKNDNSLQKLKVCISCTCKSAAFCDKLPSVCCNVSVNCCSDSSLSSAKVKQQIWRISKTIPSNHIYFSKIFLPQPSLIFKKFEQDNEKENIPLYFLSFWESTSLCGRKCFDH